LELVLQQLHQHISEIAPAKDRGKLVAFYQFNIVLGILVAFLSNYLLKDIEKTHGDG
jgi:capsular polysaccharide biosynthesis protein